MVKILVADKLDSSVVQEAKARENVELDVKTGLSEEQLAEIVGGYDGMIIRSGVKVTAKVLANPGRLRAVARAGVGVDNVDLDAATRAGVLVINTPDANTVATAEHAFALLLALMRNVVPACVDTKAGNWNRSRFVGRQLAGKTLGLIGLGRVGRAVAERALAFKMSVCAYDPLFPGDSALDGRVRLVHDLPEMLRTIDVLSVHASLTDKTRDLIGAEELAVMKSTAVIVNDARGGIINEDALYEAVREGRIAGAALDVYSSEPPGKLPLFELENVVTTCHLGASTHEAQLAVSRDAMAGLLDYLLHGSIQSAVNVTGVPATVSSVQQGYIDLARRMAVLLGLIGEGGIRSVNVTTTNAEAEAVLPLLLRSALVELLRPYLETSINVVNAELLACSSGIKLAWSAKSRSPSEPDRLRIEVTAEDGEHSITGTLSGHGEPLVLNIDGYRMQMTPEGIMIVIVNDDQPGAIGLVGTTFGQHGINIADLTLSRRKDRAMMVFKIDAPAPPEAIEQLRKSHPPIRQVATTELGPLPNSRQG